MPIRRSLAVKSVGLVNQLSQKLGRGQGTVAGGRVGLAIDPHLLGDLTANKCVVLVSGTNGKTTTTALIASGLRTHFSNVATNDTGSNMPAGHVAALVDEEEAQAVVLEVDENYVPRLLETSNPAVISLLNLSRDQLDRMSEVRMLAQRWRDALSRTGGIHVVANADDPLVVYAAFSASEVTWVAGGLVWKEDAAGCPQCSGHIVFGKHDTWACDSCDLARPEPTWTMKGNLVHSPLGAVHLNVMLPGSFNRSNSLMALAAVTATGAEITKAARAISSVESVAGRFQHRRRPGQDARLMLAKNPAGWAALLEVVEESATPVVVSINSRTADGADPSWLFDVDFSSLRNRVVIVTGDRWRDLSVRLHYGGVDHSREADPEMAIARAAKAGDGTVDFIGNYTAFQEVTRARS